MEFYKDLNILFMSLPLPIPYYFTQGWKQIFQQFILSEDLQYLQIGNIIILVLKATLENPYQIYKLCREAYLAFKCWLPTSLSYYKKFNVCVYDSESVCHPPSIIFCPSVTSNWQTENQD